MFSNPHLILLSISCCPLIIMSFHRQVFSSPYILILLSLQPFVLLSLHWLSRALTLVSYCPLVLMSPCPAVLMLSLPLNLPAILFSYPHMTMSSFSDVILSSNPHSSMSCPIFFWYDLILSFSYHLSYGSHLSLSFFTPSCHLNPRPLCPLTIMSLVSDGQ